MESNFAVTYIILEAGPSENPFPLVMQIGGVFASVLTLAKACTDWHLYTNFNSYDRNQEHQIPPRKSHSLKALLFFVPHVVFKTTATAMVAAFLKIYSIIPLTVFFILSVVITCAVHKSRRKTDSDFSFPLSLFAPSVSDPESKFGWSLLKATMLASTLALLPSLILIRLLPLLSPETISCTLGLAHLNHSFPIPSCSPCFNTTTGNSTGAHFPGTACVMVTTLDDFSTYFFLPLMILGAWCLFEGGTFHIFICLLTFILFKQKLLSSSRSAGHGPFPIGGQRRPG